MNAHNMNYREVVAASMLWAPASGPVPSDTRAFLEASPYSAPFLPELDAARLVLSRAPAEGSEYARLTDALDAADARHDAAARYAIALLGLAAHHAPAELATRAKTLLDLLFPDRGAVVNDSYEGTVGRVEARARAMTPETRADLARYPAPGGASAETLVDAVNAAATEMGSLSAQRAALGVGGTLPTNRELLEAKRTVIAIVSDLLRSFAALAELPVSRGLDENGRLKAAHLREVWNQAAHAATVRSRSAGPAPAAPGAGGPTPAPGGS